jgi:hypothetical protein
MTGTTISGAYTSGITLSGTYNPVYFTGSINTDTGNALTGPAGTLWTVVNSGLIDSAGVFAYGIYLASGGSVTNQSAGSISGADAGVAVQVAAGTVINTGTINATGNGAGAGVALNAGGSVTNTVATATITGTFDGVYAQGGAASVSNLGSIIGLGPLGGGDASSVGVQLNQGGSVVNGQSGTTLGQIYGYSTGIDIDGPTVGATSLGAGTVTNYGTIIGHSLLGVDLEEGGVVVNGASGASPSTAYIYGGAGGVYINFKNIVNAPNLPGTVTNYGTIKGSGNNPGVELDSSGLVTNAQGALISGYSGVLINDVVGFTSTVTNAGTITATGPSNYAVMLSGPGDRLVIDPGAVFNGNVGGATGTLELASGASAGTLSGLGGQFSGQFNDFTQITIDASAIWTLTGTNTVWSGATLTNAGTLTVADTTLSVAGSVVNNGIILVDPSTLTLADLTGTGQVVIDSTSTLVTQGTVATGETIAFASHAGQLDMTPAVFSGEILGFVTGDTIELTGVTDATSAGIVNGDTLQIERSSNPAILLDLDPNQDYTGVSFPIGTDITDGYNTVTTDLACFAEGTRIDTPDGPVAVEALRAGVLVLTVGGGARAVRWIGHRRLDLRCHSDPAAVQPVRILADAFAPGAPRRALRLSPDHALLIGGELVPVRLLVNGATISRDDAGRSVTYYHVELDTHDVLLAEGLAAESYFDTGNRGMFENGDLPLTLHPDPGACNDQARREADSCAPFVADAERVAPIWHALAERARALGHTLPAVTTTDDPAFRIEIDGKRLKPVTMSDGRHVFVLPETPSSVRLVSRATAPHALRAWVEDRRSLGVMVRRLTVRHGDTVEVIPLDHPRLRDGWWALERDGWRHARWTNGSAELPLEPGGPAILEVEIGTMPGYLVADAAAVSGPIRQAARQA